MVAVGVGAVDALAVQAADAGAEPHADHAEGGEVDLGVAVGVGVVLFEVEVALVVEDAGPELYRTRRCSRYSTAARIW